MGVVNTAIRGGRYLQSILFIIILVEGYVVLASELLALRILVAFVGSDSATISIIVSAVLMPLAAGYYKGGQKYHTLRATGKQPSIRKLLIRNIAVASIFLALGLSHMFLELYFGGMAKLGITSRIYQAMLYSAVFLVYPVYLLGQTTPLISNYFTSEILSKITGKMLFCSTLGSFMGAIISTLLLMGWIGVHNTAILTVSLLGVVFMLLNKQWFTDNTVLIVTALLTVWYFNSGNMMKSNNILANNQYHMISIEDIKDESDSRFLIINRAYMSKISEDKQKFFGDIRYIEDYVIHFLPKDPQHPKDILVLGAGGFSIGLEDTVNHYDFVDIDGDLLKIAEEDFLKQKLTPNKKFFVVPARVFLRNRTKQYDVIVLDTFSNPLSVPYDMVTQEYFYQVKDALNSDGVVAANIVERGNFSDKWTIKFENTFRSVFPHYTRVSTDPFNPWAVSSNQVKDDGIIGIDRNVVYVYYNRNYSNDTIYTDTKNDYLQDRQP